MNQQNKTPGLINWLGYLAITLLLVLPISVLMVRSGAWQQGLLLYAIACLGSMVVIIVALILLMWPRYTPWRKKVIQRGLIAAPGAVLLLSLTTGGDYPRIHDISTDTSDPPIFTAALQQRGTGANPLDINQDVITLQQEAFPDLQTLETPLSFDEAYSRALQVATGMGWDIYRQDLNAGAIEAVDTTRIMAFKDDVVIRVRTSAQGTLLDLRSVSRVGEGDIGANAKRIRAFLEAFQK